MKQDNVNFGEGLLAVVSLLESAVTGNLLNNQPIDGVLFRYYCNLNKALIDYLNNSAASNDVGADALKELIKYADNKQSIYDRKCALDETDQFIAMKR